METVVSHPEGASHSHLFMLNSERDHCHLAIIKRDRYPDESTERCHS